MMIYKYKLNSSIQNRKTVLALSAFFILVTLSSSLFSEQGFSGQWNRKSLQFTVNIQSWGKYCGVKPHSYYSKQVTSTEIMESNGQLFFSKGRLRTDRCNSPNPDLKIIKKNKSSGNWKMECETPPAISKYENINYSLTGTKHKLIYIAKSSFKWTLNNDHCQVNWTEKRVYERQIQPKLKPLKDLETSPILKVHDDSSTVKTKQKKENSPIISTVDLSCLKRGKIVRLIIFPQDSIIRPSGKICFMSQGVDKKGCRFSVKPKWSVTQSGISRNDLLKKGCFIAGDNAAESEGVYDVIATLGTVVSKTTVEVSFPDMEDLARARLDLPTDIDTDSNVDNLKKNDTETDNNNSNMATILPVTSPVINPALKNSSKKENKGNSLLLIILFVIITAITIFILFYILKIKKHKQHDISDDADDTDDALNSSIILYCPQCHRIFKENAKFCPHDASELKRSKSGQNSSANNNLAMVCPKCDRGYDANSKFCPHDRTQLITYSNWKKRDGF